MNMQKFSFVVILTFLLQSLFVFMDIKIAAILQATRLSVLR